MPPLPADSIHARACKLKCEKILTRPTPAGRKRYRASESKRSFSENVNEFGRGFAKASLKASYGRIMGEGLVKDISKMQTAKGKAFVGLLGGYARGNLINIYIRILLIRCLIASVVDCSFHFR